MIYLFLQGSICHLNIVIETDFSLIYFLKIQNSNGSEVVRDGRTREALQKAAKQKEMQGVGLPRLQQRFAWRTPVET